MRFKMTSKNPFRNFLRNLRRITISNLNDKDKDILYRQLYNEMKISHINIGFGEDLAIAELANIIANIVGYKGEIRYDSSKPDGIQKKLLDISRLKDIGWQHTTSLDKGIDTAYKWFMENISRWP